MNLQINARSFISEADCQQRYKAAGQRLWGTPDRKRASPAVEAEERTASPVIRIFALPTAAMLENEPKHHVSAWLHQKSEEAKSISPTAYIQARCVEIGMSYGTIIAKGRRTKEIVEVRHPLIFEVTVIFPHLSYWKVGKEFGGLDHSSIGFAVNKMRDKIGLERREQRRQKVFEREFIAAIKGAYLAGRSTLSISNEYPISKTTVSRLAEKLGWKEEMALARKAAAYGYEEKAKSFKGCENPFGS